MSEQDVERARVEIYTWQYCSYCLAAKRLLKHKGVEFVEYAIDHDENHRARMAARANGRRTLPQIFINDRHIGGYSELAHLERSGQLDGLLSKGGVSD